MTIRNGPTKYPGAKNVELKQDKRRIHLGLVNAELIDLKEEE